MVNRKDLYTKLGSRMRALREEEGISQEEWGKRINPDKPMLKQAVGQMENGRVTISVEKLVRVAIAAGVEPGELIRMDV
jgi:transcriptional regulator with XRE-family HTH domain